jgi:flagellar hook-associated protein 1 FlgK
MSNLFATLQTSASALGVFQAALSVSANNVANASTPGYVRQTQGIKALPFDSGSGSQGGVAATQVESARDIYAERAVQLQVTLLGTSQQQVATLSPIQSSFDITGTTGIPGALNKLYSAFSTWGTTPNDRYRAARCPDSGARRVPGVSTAKHRPRPGGRRRG